MTDEAERERLLYIVDLIGNFIVKSVDTSDKRNIYSKSLLGVRKEIEIEKWVEKHFSDIAQCVTEDGILRLIFPL